MELRVTFDRDTPALVFVVLAFLTCGGVYLIFPEQHYTVGWATAIKYVFVLLGMLLVAATAKISVKALRVPHFLAAAWVFAVGAAMLLGVPASRGLVYSLPVVFMFLPRETRAYVPLLGLITLLVATFCAPYEALVVGGFGYFADYGYRASSIFINPNNLAITAVIALSLVMEIKNRTYTTIGFACTGLLVVASSSKAGLLLLAVLIVFHAMKVNLRLAIWAFLGCLSIAVIGLLFDWFRAPFLSVYFRLEQVVGFVTSISNPLFPFYERVGSAPYVDNVYLQTWNELGAPAAVVLVCALIYVGWRDRTKHCAWLLFAVTGFSENFIYLWPLAYLFWIYTASPLAQMPAQRN